MSEIDHAELLGVGAKQLSGMPDLQRDLQTFVDMWGLDGYTPPHHIERSVRNLVQVFLSASQQEDAGK